MSVGAHPFRYGFTEVNGVRLHHVTAGSGPPVLLVPGWPQSWYTWRKVMPLLAAAGRTVCAVDPRGFGDSAKPTAGYDLDTVAADLRELAALLDGGAPVDVVAHDVGSWICHAWATTSPAGIRSLVLVDAVIPGVTPPPPGGFPNAEVNMRTWHFAFNRLPGLPELLLAGREREFLAWLFASKGRVPGVFDDAALDEYARVLAAPDAVRAGMDYYRVAFSAEGLARAAERAGAVPPTPVFTVGGDGGVGSLLQDTLAAAGARVTGTVFADCGHYVPEERPGELARAVLDFWSGLKPA